jgi:AraC-like DNA-binding protein
LRTTSCNAPAWRRCSTSQWRLRVAADSLAHSNQAIEFVAESAGFGSTPAFTRAFKREFGESRANETKTHWPRAIVPEAAYGNGRFAEGILPP